MSEAASDLGVAVIGAGAWGKNHVRNFARMPGARLRHVCDADAEARRAVAAAHPGVAVAPEARAAFDDPSVAAVVIATDAPSHADLARAALDAGKDVLVEKPLALSSADAEALCELADANGRILMVGHLLLYHPAVDLLRRLVAEGELGDILYLTCQRLNLGVVRRDENAWWSLAPHDVSVANFLLGAEPEEVNATGAAFLQVERGVEDVVFATMHYPDRRLAHVHVSWLDPHKTRRITVVGSRKMAVFDDTSADQKLVVFDKGVEPPPATLSYAEGIRVRTGDIRIPALRMAEPLRREGEAFLESVRTREPPRADGRSGLAVVRTLEAGSRSMAAAGRGVEVASAGRGDATGAGREQP
ncbi:MAG: Gfo/Idh/MocA family protein [Myxococcota bacterium]